MSTPSPPTAWPVALALLCAIGPAAEAQAPGAPNPALAAAVDTLHVRPLGPVGPAGGEVYAVPRLLLEDYVVCTVEARTLRLQTGQADDLTAALSRQLDARADQVGALTDAAEACDLARRLTSGRLDAARADATALRAELDAAQAQTSRVEASRGRWKLFAALGPLTAAGAGFVVGILLSR